MKLRPVSLGGLLMDTDIEKRSNDSYAFAVLRLIVC